MAADQDPEAASSTQASVNERAHSNDQAPKQEKGKRGPKPGQPDKEDAELDVFLLERLFPQAHELFLASPEPDPNADCLVALDTNALLLPYSTKEHGPKDIAVVYSKLAETNRLFLPERVAREFIKHRDRKLADMVKSIGDMRSRVNIGERRISPLLEELPEYKVLEETSNQLMAAKKSYFKALDGLQSTIRAWRGNDPVAKLYVDLFTKERLVRPIETDGELKSEWVYRARNKVPPGYKDSGKGDKGIGDFAIWMSLLHLGATYKKDLIFVTGEEKADWFVRSDGERVYPRPELIDEYRRKSGGRTIRLSSLAELLREMAAPEGLVDDVQAAELSANSAILNASSISTLKPVMSAGHLSVLTNSAKFNYSTNDGVMWVQRAGKSFELRFSSSGVDTVHLYRSGRTSRIARVKEPFLSSPTSVDAQETSSRIYTIHVDEGFLIENLDGDVLAGRITGIGYEGRNSDHHEVRFDYNIYGRGERIIMP